jgi:nitrogen fixation protein NifU and related proteins
MSEYNELYQEVILEHNKKPRNFQVLEGATSFSVGKNPLCGDQFAVYVKVNDAGIIEDIAFQGSGCAIAKASASMMTSFIKGKPVSEAFIVKDQFHQMVTGQLDPEQNDNCLGRLKILAGVKQYPVRVKCATLAWHTMDAALKGQQETSTENVGPPVPADA